MLKGSIKGRERLPLFTLAVTQAEKGYAFALLDYGEVVRHGLLTDEESLRAEVRHSYRDAISDCKPLAIVAERANSLQPTQTEAKLVKRLKRYLSEFRTDHEIHPSRVLVLPRWHLDAVLEAGEHKYERAVYLGAFAARSEILGDSFASWIREFDTLWA